MDSVKGSLSSLEAADAVREGILRAHPKACIIIRPLADGGEGTVDALIAGLDAERTEAEVSGPLGEPVRAVYGIKGDLAVMEMAAAAGLPLVPLEKRDGVSASTYGVGEMIAHALKRGCRRFVMGIGGSATTEGGMGICVGRLRKDPIFDYKFVCLSHNTLRGAAGGGLLTAEFLYAKGLLD